MGIRTVVIYITSKGIYVWSGFLWWHSWVPSNDASLVKNSFQSPFRHLIFILNQKLHFPHFPINVSAFLRIKRKEVPSRMLFKHKTFPPKAYVISEENKKKSIEWKWKNVSRILLFILLVMNLEYFDHISRISFLLSSCSKHSGFLDKEDIVNFINSVSWR